MYTHIPTYKHICIYTYLHINTQVRLELASAALPLAALPLAAPPGGVTVT